MNKTIHTDQEIVPKELRQLHADDVVVQGEQVEGPLVPSHIWKGDEHSGALSLAVQTPTLPSAVTQG